VGRLMIIVCSRSFHAVKGAAQRGAARVSCHRKEHRRRQHGQSSSTAPASQSATAAGSPSVADSNAFRQAHGEHGRSAAWDGVFELSHDEQPRASGPHGGFASISEAALVVRRGYPAQQQHHYQPPQHAQLVQHPSSARQPSAAGSSRPAGIMGNSAPRSHGASDGRQDSHATCSAVVAGCDLSVVSRHGSGIRDGDGSRQVSGSAADALRQTSTAAVNFRVGSGAATMLSTAAGTDPLQLSSSPAQHDAWPESAVASAADPAPPASSVTNPWVDSSAALCASAITSLVEGPLEMFRHRLQVSVLATLRSHSASRDPCACGYCRDRGLLTGS